MAHQHADERPVPPWRDDEPQPANTPEAPGMLRKALDADHNNTQASLSTLLEHLARADAFELNALASDPKTSPSLDALEARRGCRQSVRAIRRQVEDARNQQQAEEEEEAAQQRPVPLDAVLADRLGAPAGLSVPAHYKFTRDGVFHLCDQGTKQVTRTPFVLTGLTVDVDGGPMTVDAAFLDHGQRQTVTVPRTMLATREITTLADRGLDVTSNTQRALIDFVQAFQNTNRGKIPQARGCGRSGWVDDDAFLMGSRCEFLDGTAPVRFMVDGAGSMAHAAAFTPGGTLDGWREMVAQAQRHPKVMLTIYAALAPPLLRFLPARPFVFENAGRTTRGKTTALRLAASAWGEPSDGRQVRSWDVTPAGVGELLTLHRDVPLFLDDTKNARKPRKGERPVQAQIVYDLANGTGRTRSDRGQRVQPTATYRTVLLSTGEDRITDATTDAGARARAIVQWGSPFEPGETVAATADRLLLLAEQHYGHAGPAVVRWLLDPNNTADLADRWQRHRTAYSARVEGDVAKRLAAHVATLHLAGEVAREALGVGFNPAVMDAAVLAIEEGGQDADQALEALSAAWNLLASPEERSHRTKSRAGSSRQVHRSGNSAIGVVWDDGRWALIPSVVRQHLTANGFEANAMVRHWRDRGWLRVAANNRNTRPVDISGRSHRCYEFTKAAAAALTGSVEVDA